MMATISQALDEALGSIARRVKQAVSPLPLPGIDEFEVELAAKIQQNFEELGV